MLDTVFDLVDTVKYDLMGMEPPELPSFKMDVTLKLHNESGGVWVESPSHPGLIASGKNIHELREALFDTLLTYYDVPRYQARRMKDKLVLHLPDGTEVLPPEPSFVVKIEYA